MTSENSRVLQRERIKDTFKKAELDGILTKGFFVL